jgi:hypothetical protein
MGGLNDSSDPSQTDFSNTLIQHKYRSCITPDIPQVIFSDDGEGRLVFGPSDWQEKISSCPSPSLVDAIKQPSRLKVQGFSAVPVNDEASPFRNGTGWTSGPETGKTCDE